MEEKKMRIVMTKSININIFRQRLAARKNFKLHYRGSMEKMLMYLMKWRKFKYFLSRKTTLVELFVILNEDT
jgi:hypothetical protein